LAVSLIAFRDVLLRPGTIGYNHDWAMPPFPSAALQLVEWLRSGWTTFGLGGEVYFVGYWGVLPMLALAYLDLGGEVISKGYVVGITAAAGIAFYAFLRWTGLRRAPSSAGGLLYMFTPTVFNRLAAGHVYHLFGYALLPVLVIAFCAFLRARGWRRVAAFCAAVLTYGVLLAQLQFALVAALVLLGYGLGDGLSKRSPRRVLLNLLSAALIAGLALTLYAPWLLPKFAYLGETLSQGAASFSSKDWLLNQLEKGNFLRAFTLRFGLLVYFEEGLEGGWKAFRASGGMDERFIGLATFAWIGVALTIFLVGLCAIFFTRNGRLAFHVKLWSALTLMGILLSSGTNPINLSIWLFLFERAPFLLAYLGELENVVYIPTVGLVFLFAASLNELTGGRFGNLPRRGKAIGLGMLALLLVGYALPSLLNYGSWLVPFSLDDSYRRVYDRFSRDPSDFRALWIPPIGEYGSSLKGRSERPFTLGGTDPLFTFPPKPSISQFQGGGVYTGWNPYRDGLRAYMLFLSTSLYANRTQYLADLLDMSAMKYLLLRPDAYSFVLRKVVGDADQAEVSKDRLLAQRKILEERDVGIIKVFGGAMPPTALYGVPPASAALIAGDLADISALSYFYNEVRGGEPHRLYTFTLQLSPHLVGEARERFRLLVVDPASAGDLEFSLLDERLRLYPGAYANRADPSDYVQPDRGPSWWGIPIWPIEWEMVAQPYVVAYALGRGASLDLAAHVPWDGAYWLSAKLLTGPDSMGIQFYVDGTLVGNASTRGPADYFRWYRVGPVRLDGGTHKFTLVSQSDREAAGVMALIPVGVEVDAGAYSSMRPVYVMELERPLRGAGYRVLSEGIGASGGQVLQASAEGARAQYEVPFLQPGDYTVWLRASEVERVDLQFRGEEGSATGSVQFPASKDYGWGMVKLSISKAGWHSLTIGARPGAKLDLMVIEPSDRPADLTSLALKYRRHISRIYASLDSKAPTFIVDSQSFNRYWKGYGPIDSAFPANGFGKAYHVEASSPQEMILSYSKDWFFLIGWALASAVYAVLFTALMASLLRLRKRRRRR